MDQRNRGRRARRARHAGEEQMQEPARPVAVRRDGPDFEAILGRFSDALAMIAVVGRSLSARESSGIGDEEVALRRAIDELKAVYNELDAVAVLIRSAVAP